MNEKQLVNIGDKTFMEMFKSLQLLGFTVLYYNFDMDKDQLGEFNRILHEKNDAHVKDLKIFDSEAEQIEKIWGKKIDHIVKEFPYRARVRMIGGLPKKPNMMKLNMAMLQSLNAVDTYLILAFVSLMEMNSKFGKVQMDLFWRNLKDNAMNYANGMEDKFIVEYFENEIDLTLKEGDERIE